MDFVKWMLKSWKSINHIYCEMGLIKAIVTQTDLNVLLQSDSESNNNNKKITKKNRKSELCLLDHIFDISMQW